MQVSDISLDHDGSFLGQPFNTFGLLVDSWASWSLIHGVSWSSLIKTGLADNKVNSVFFNGNISTFRQSFNIMSFHRPLLKIAIKLDYGLSPCNYGTNGRLVMTGLSNEISCNHVILCNFLPSPNSLSANGNGKHKNEFHYTEKQNKLHMFKPTSHVST